MARNFAAIDGALDALHRVEVPAEATGTRHRRPTVSEQAPDFVKRVTARMLEGNGDLLPVSALPVDGAFPTGTAKWEKRLAGRRDPHLGPVDLHRLRQVRHGLPPLDHPHEGVRPRGPGGRPGPLRGQGLPLPRPARMKLTIQVAPDDCTGCGVCVEVCPAHSKEEVKHKAINMTPVDEFLERERERWDFFLELPELDRERMAPDTIKGSQVRQPLFEFSGACAGCGETQYLKLISQLFGDRLLVANATGCSSIYGGNLPTTPWTVNAEGRGRPGPTRCSRTTPSSGWASAWPPTGRRPGPASSRAARPPGRRPGRRHPRRRPGRRGRGRRPAGAGRRAAPAAGRDRHLGRPGAGGAGRRAGPAQRLDRRRGRLGL